MAGTTGRDKNPPEADKCRSYGRAERPAGIARDGKGPVGRRRPARPTERRRPEDGAPTGRGRWLRRLHRLETCAPGNGRGASAALRLYSGQARYRSNRNGRLAQACQLYRTGTAWAHSCAPLRTATAGGDRCPRPTERRRPEDGAPTGRGRRLRRLHRLETCATGNGRGASAALRLYSGQARYRSNRNREGGRRQAPAEQNGPTAGGDRCPRPTERTNGRRAHPP